MEEGVRKTTHAGQTVSKTVAEEPKCVKCDTTQRLCIDPQCVKDGHYSKLWLQSGTTSPCRHLRRRQARSPRWAVELSGVSRLVTVNTESDASGQ